MVKKIPHSQAQTGNVALIFVVALPLIMVIMAFVVDYGRGVVKRAHLQNAADAAALAGARELPFDEYSAQTVALDYATRFGVAPGDVSVTFPGDDYSRISVTIRENLQYLFAPIIRKYSTPVTVDAEAASGVVGALTGVIPIGVEQENFVYGDVYVLKLGAGACDKTGSPGVCSNYGPLALGGTGASNYESNLMNGYQGRLEAGMWVLTETGDMVGPTKSGISFRIDANPNEKFDNIATGSKRLVFLPVIESLDVGGRADVKVVGFAAFFLDSLVKSSEVKGRFLKYATSGEIHIPAVDFGLRSVGLSK
jgi:hypothetical protein